MHDDIEVASNNVVSLLIAEVPQLLNADSPAFHLLSEDCAQVELVRNKELAEGIHWEWWLWKLSSSGCRLLTSSRFANVVELTAEVDEDLGTRKFLFTLCHLIEKYLQRRNPVF